MPGTVRPETSSGYLQKTNVGFVREKKVCYFLNLPLDKSHFITEVGELNVNEKLLKIVSLRSEDEVILRDQIAMLWHWRAIEGKNTMFKKEPVKDVLLEIFSDAYKDAVNTILKRQKKKQDFMVGDKYVYELNAKEIRHLYMRTRWRYHAFEWLLTEEDWDNVSLNT